MEAEKNVSYTAVVLDHDDRYRILEELSGVLENLKASGFDTLNPNRDLVCHHMTCNMGPCPPLYRGYLGSDLILSITHWGVSDKVLAVKVDPEWEAPVKSVNKTPHVTVAVNWNAGGKPKHSNEIVVWFAIEQPLTVLGKFKEVLY